MIRHVRRRGCLRRVCEDYSTLAYAQSSSVTASTSFLTFLQPLSGFFQQSTTAKHTKSKPSPRKEEPPIRAVLPAQLSHSQSTVFKTTATSIACCCSLNTLLPEYEKYCAGVAWDSRVHAAFYQVATYKTLTACTFHAPCRHLLTLLLLPTCRIDVSSPLAPSLRRKLRSFELTLCLSMLAWFFASTLLDAFRTASHAGKGVADWRAFRASLPQGKAC